jgi:biotin carboxyl carrier protein
MSSMSSSPLPQPGGGRASAPAPALVPQPPAPVPHRSRKPFVLGVFVVLAIALGVGYYLNRGRPTEQGDGGGTILRTAAVATGDLHSTVRVNGVISAERFASLLVPQVRGSRSDRGRSGGGGGSSAPTLTVTSNAGATSSSSSSSSSSPSSSSSSGSGGGRSGFATSYSSRSSSTSSASAASSSRAGDESSGAVSTGGGGGGGGGGRRGGSDFAMVLLSLAKPGSTVKKGDVVAEFDRQSQILRADDYKDSVSQMDASLKKMRADLVVTKEIHDQTVRTAKAAWEKAELDLKTIEVLSAIQTEKYRLAVAEAKAKYEQLVAEEKLLIESQRAQVRAAEIDRDQAKIEMQRAVNNVEKLIMKAPMEGIVVMQSIFRGGDFGQIKEGDQVYSGQSFMTIVDPRSMVLNSTVNQVDAEKLRLGAKAVVNLDAYGDIRVPATVIGIGAMAKTSPFRANYVSDIPVRLKLDRVEPRIIPDLTASAEIILHSEREALIAPRAGVFEDNGAPFVFVQGSSGWIRKDVELGLRNHVGVAVKSGLRKGDIIALQRPI